ncbi:MAG: hypothetical protein RL220_527, partial [Bacteroidota bacterium]
MRWIRKYWKKFLFFTLLIPVLLFSLVVLIVYWNQDRIVSELVTHMNEDFSGCLTIEGSHISPFTAFPDISIDLEHVRIFEAKDTTQDPLLNVNELFVGFNLWKVLGGKFDIRSIQLKQGSIHATQHTDGSFNIVNALSSTKDIEEVEEDLHLDIRKIGLTDIDLRKYNEASDVLLDFYVQEATSSLSQSPDHVKLNLDSKFMLSVLSEGDSTFIRRKHFELDTQIDFRESDQVLTMQPSTVRLENGVFNMDGAIDVDDDLNMDIRFSGKKPNFDLLIAFAPNDMIPTLERFRNGGNIYFSATLKGKSVNGNLPRIDADFGCEEAFFSNRQTDRKLDELYFHGHFTSGEKGDASTMEFSLKDITARPETGTFKGDLLVRNFISPEIEMKLHADFQLEFLSRFLGVEDLQGLHGSVVFDMNFHDIIDLEHPERSIEKLNESYYTELTITDLGFTAGEFPIAVEGINVHAKMDGHAAQIDRFDIRVGSSDFHLAARIDDLPAVLHHTDIPVEVKASLWSQMLDLKELTSVDTTLGDIVDEQITNFKTDLHFIASARSFTESAFLPIGEFFIDDLFADFAHYPHTFHDFHADVIISDSSLAIKDFSGMIDKSDFHFNGGVEHYELWMSDVKQGHTSIDVQLTSDLLQLEDIFSYKGENYVPEEYRHEEIRGLKVHGVADLTFDGEWKSADLDIDKIEASMKMHPLRLERFHGHASITPDELLVDDFSGVLGRTDFAISLRRYLGEAQNSGGGDYVVLKSRRLDFDQLFAFNPAPESGTSSADHDSVFSVFDIPFSDLGLKADIGDLTYHRIHLRNLHGDIRVTKDHFLYIDTLTMDAAGGNISMSGYFNGSDRNHIYLSPQLQLTGVNLDELMFKFENFGQDHLVSENLHGKLSGRFNGKVMLHADLVPIMNQSEIHMDIEVVDGRLEHYAAFDAMAEYFADKNLKIVRFDTLSNHIDLTRGILTIPSMTINSSLGFIEISGSQDMDMNMDY